VEKEASIVAAAAGIRISGGRGRGRQGRGRVRGLGRMGVRRRDGGRWGRRWSLRD
jgi:hypothetical protein